jgi:hypothetical protein
VGNTWITDLRHYLTDTGAMAADLPPRARILAEYFASIVVDATSNIDEPPSVRCRRRPGHRRCSGIIFSIPSIAEDDEQHDPIHWHCPVCHDNGVITGWQNTLWDGFADPVATS